MNTIKSLGYSITPINSLEIPELEFNIEDNWIIRFLESYGNLNQGLVGKIRLSKDLNEVAEILIKDSELVDLLEIIKSNLVSEELKKLILEKLSSEILIETIKSHSISIEIRKILVEKLSKQTTQERWYNRYKLEWIKWEVIIFRNWVVVYWEKISIINQLDIQVIDWESEEIYNFRWEKS